MKDINEPLKKAYFDALKTITYNSVAVPVYYMTLSDRIKPDNYIIFGPVSNNDISTKGSSDTSTLMRVTIHTQANIYNPGKSVNVIAGEVYARIYPNTQSVLDLGTDFQMVSMEMVSDNTLDYSIKNSVSYIDRVIIFRQLVYHR